MAEYKSLENASKRKNSASTRGEAGLSLDAALSEMGMRIDDAEDFVSSELEGDWELAERYYQGETDLPITEGRSNVVKTEVRDAIRNSMPSIMRTLLHSRKPVEYEASSLQHANWVDLQSEYISSKFYALGGYTQLYTCVLEALKLKIGPMKVFHEIDPIPVYEKYTNVPFETVQALMDHPLFDVEDFEESEATQLPTQLGEEEVTTFDVWGYRTKENGQNVIEAVPNYEFFISRNVNSIEMALRQGVHGQRGIVTVSEAMDMGLECDDWIALDYEDPEESDFTSSSTSRRDYQKEDDDNASEDVLNHQFVLTEAYASYDLKGTGRSQIYKFFFGGSSRKYLHHEEVEDSPYALVIPIPIPHTVYGHSIPDLTIKEQDTSTSLLRATVDNAHAANNARIAADPQKTNFDDLMNPALQAPIRKRAGDTLQVIQVPFTGQGSLGLLQYLDQDVQNKVGVTKAAQGLDPDAMQSTDKAAVMNTIQAAQGQTELMVRNIIETGLIRAFRLLLRLEARHSSPIQMMQFKGKQIPVDISNFDVDAVATPNVGLGTSSPMQKQQALSAVLAKQEGYMQQFGPNNPFTSYSQIYNTMEDLLEAQGLHNTSRYFNIVTPDVEKAYAEQQEKAKAAQAEAAQKSQPMDPTKAFIQVETGKQHLKQVELATTQQYNASRLELEAIKASEDLDIKRDQLVQKRVIDLATIRQNELSARIEQEQANNVTISRSATGGGGEQPKEPRPTTAGPNPSSSSPE